MLLTQSEYTIGTPVIDDAESIVVMHARSWVDSYPNEEAGVSLEWVQERVSAWLTPEGIARRAARIEESNTTPSMFLRIAKNAHGDVIGMVSGHKMDHMQHLNALYIDKAYYGSGLGQALIEQLLDWTDPRRPVDLEVVNYNKRARAFYRKYKFREVDDSEHIVHEVLPAIRMIRKGDN